MITRTKARGYALAGIVIGAGGIINALWCGHRLTVAFAGVMWGATLVLAAMAWYLTR